MNNNIKKVKCKSGLIGWRGSLRDVYSDFEDFEAYDSAFNIHSRLGYSDKNKCWEDNPIIEGSSLPSDFRIVNKNDLRN